MSYELVIETIKNKNKFSYEDLTQLYSCTSIVNRKLLDNFLSDFLHTEIKDFKKVLTEHQINIDELCTALENFQLIIKKVK